MQWFQRVIEWSKFSARAVAASERLADECLAAVVLRLRQDVLAMSMAEARGYIRARAELVLRNRMTQVLANPDFAGVNPNVVRRLAHETLARNVVKQVRLDRARYTTPAARAA